jgi:hypothetical protein
MIDSDKQLSITRNLRARFVQTLDSLLVESAHEPLSKLTRHAIESVIAEFDRDIADYLARQNNRTLTDKTA